MIRIFVFFRENVVVPVHSDLLILMKKEEFILKEENFANISDLIKYESPKDKI